jgi:hypothetical protein
MSACNHRRPMRRLLHALPLSLPALLVHAAFTLARGGGGSSGFGGGGGGWRQRRPLLRRRPRAHQLAGDRDRLRLHRRNRDDGEPGGALRPIDQGQAFQACGDRPSRLVCRTRRYDVRQEAPARVGPWSRAMSAYPPHDPVFAAEAVSRPPRRCSRPCRRPEHQRRRRDHPTARAGPGRRAGEHALFFAAHGLDVVGVDASAIAVQRATDRARERGLSARFLEADVQELAGLGETFDTITDSGCLAHALRRRDDRSDPGSACRAAAGRHVLADVLQRARHRPKGRGGSRNSASPSCSAKAGASRASRQQDSNSSKATRSARTAHSPGWRASSAADPRPSSRRSSAGVTEAGGWVSSRQSRVRRTTIARRSRCRILSRDAPEAATPPAWCRTAVCFKACRGS